MKVPMIFKLLEWICWKLTENFFIRISYIFIGINGKNVYNCMEFFVWTSDKMLHSQLAEYITRTRELSLSEKGIMKRLPHHLVMLYQF